MSFKALLTSEFGIGLWVAGASVLLGSTRGNDNDKGQKHQGG